MDIFAHGLWTVAGYKLLSEKKKVAPALAAFFSIMPDLFAFSPVFFWGLFQFLTGDGADVPRSVDGLPNYLSSLTFFLYQMSHSAIVFFAIFFSVWFLTKRPLLELFGWFFHILIDIPSHTTDGHFATPFLWPISSFHVNGISWADPRFLFPNYLTIFLIYLFLFNRKKEHWTRASKTMAIVFLIGGFFFASFRLYRAVRPVIMPPPIDITQALEGDPAKFPLKLPAGFTIRVIAKNLSAPRVLALDVDENLFVSVPKEGKVYLLRDTDNDGKRENIPVLSNLRRPHGLAFFQNYLYVAEEHRVVRYPYEAASRKVTPQGEKILDLPAGGNHTSRTIQFGPDGKLYTSIGSACNVCHEDHPWRGTIVISNPDGSDARIFAKGLRNAVFFTFHPRTMKLYATEMGRDFLGDELPPDEINMVTDGGDYGWPVCYGKRVHDTQFDKRTSGENPCLRTEPSTVDLPAHVAPLGIRFDQKAGFLYGALHGSWNRSIPTGYKVIRFPIDVIGNPGPSEDFLSGFLTSDFSALGRPVDIIFDVQNRMFISDDKAGVVYMVAGTEALAEK